MHDNILPGLLSCAETGALKRTIWPVGFLLWGCISKHTALQGARTRLFPAESFLRLTSSNKVSAVLHRQTRQNGDDHSSIPLRYQVRETVSLHFCKSRTFLISHSPGSQPPPVNSLPHLWEGFKMSLQKNINVTRSQYHSCLLN